MTDDDWDIVAAAHDRLHKGAIDEAHELLHKALGVENDAAPVERKLVHLRNFDAAFRTACKKNGVRAMYIVVESTDGRHARLVTGGDADCCAIVDPLLRGRG